jgi:hypothetical protein
MMWLILSLSLVVYIIGMRITAPKMAAAHARTCESRYPLLVHKEPEQFRRESRNVGLAWALIWPSLLIGNLLMITLSGLTGKKSVVFSFEEKERVEKMKARIRQLEGELGYTESE